MDERIREYMEANEKGWMDLPADEWLRGQAHWNQYIEDEELRAKVREAIALLAIETTKQFTVVLPYDAPEEPIDRPIRSWATY
jgi:hypothetical protein